MACSKLEPWLQESISPLLTVPVTSPKGCTQSVLRETEAGEPAEGSLGFQSEL